jgi:hypothetical protein
MSDSAATVSALPAEREPSATPTAREEVVVLDYGGQ